MSYNPIIILGMHRSGTSLIARCLEDSGLFIGKKKDENDEAWFFLNLNNWMLRQTNASWDNPYNFQFLNESVRREILRVIEFHLANFFSRKKFLGLDKSLRYKNIKEIDIPWGWKDPRNTFTIDVWKEIFPEAKLIHVYRNPADVAVSLKKREEFEKEKTATGLRRTPINTLKELLLKGTISYQISVRVENFAEGFKLWEDYVKKALSLDALFGNRIIHVKFEDFLQQPKSEFKKILSFIELKVSDTEQERSVKKVDPERAWAFLNNEEMKELFRSQFIDNEYVKKLGYSNIV